MLLLNIRGNMYNFWYTPLNICGNFWDTPLRHLGLSWLFFVESPSHLLLFSICCAKLISDVVRLCPGHAIPNHSYCSSV